MTIGIFTKQRLGIGPGVGNQIKCIDKVVGLNVPSAGTDWRWKAYHLRYV